jgi:hypothetical protein
MSDMKNGLETPEKVKNEVKETPAKVAKVNPPKEMLVKALLDNIDPTAVVARKKFMVQQEGAKCNELLTLNKGFVTKMKKAVEGYKSPHLVAWQEIFQKADEWLQYTVIPSGENHQELYHADAHLLSKLIQVANQNSRNIARTKRKRHEELDRRKQSRTKTAKNLKRFKKLCAMREAMKKGKVDLGEASKRAKVEMPVMHFTVKTEKATALERAEKATGDQKGECHETPKGKMATTDRSSECAESGAYSDSYSSSDDENTEKATALDKSSEAYKTLIKV